MSGWRRDDGGAVAAEAGLLLVAVAILVVLSMFSLGKAINGLLGNVRHVVQSGSSGQPPGGASPGPSGPAPTTAAEATALLEQEIATQLAQSDPAAGTPQVACPPLAEVTPPKGSTTTCTVQVSGGSTSTVVVTWVDDAGHFQVAPG